MHHIYIYRCIKNVHLADRLKRSSMRTQATQTDVKKSPAPALPIQHPATNKNLLTSPRMQKKVIYFQH